MQFHVPGARISFGEETCWGMCEGPEFVLSSHPAVLTGWREGFGFVSLLLAAGPFFLCRLFRSGKIYIFFSLSFAFSLSLSVCLSCTHPPSSDPILASLLYFPLIALMRQSQINEIIFCSLHSGSWVVLVNQLS